MTRGGPPRQTSRPSRTGVRVNALPGRQSPMGYAENDGTGGYGRVWLTTLRHHVPRAGPHKKRGSDPQVAGLR